MYDVQLKNKAQALRKKGMGIHDISRALNLNPTTISYWCRDIKLSKFMLNKISMNGRLRARSSMLIYTEKQREAGFDRIKASRSSGAKLVGSLSKRDLLMVGLGLYWGEGYKGSDGEFGFTNSNLDIMKFYIKWLDLFGVKKEDLILKLTINNAFKDQETKLKKFWVNNLKINEKQFTATTYVKTNLKKAVTTKGNTYRGILRIKVRKGNTLKNKILGAIDHIALVSS